MNFAANIHMTYDCSLLSKYGEVQLSFIQMTVISKSKVWGTGTFSFTVIIDIEALHDNFLKLFHSPYLEYNLLSVGIINEDSDSVLGKNGKMMIFGDKDKVSLVEIQIGIHNSVDESCNEI